MLKTGIYSALAILGSLAINPAMAEDKAAAIVNGVSISQTRIDLSVKAAAAQGQVDSPELRKAVRDDMINREVIAQESVKMGLNKDPDVIQQTELAKQQILIGAFVQDYVKSHPISDEQIKQEYEKLTGNLGEKEYKARHILVDTEAEAKSIIAQLGKKGSFEKIAKAKSKDAGSAANGGELDWAVPSNFVPPFANALLSLKKGSYTKEPVKSQFGWHVIKLDDERGLKVPPLETVKPQIQQRLQQQSLQATVLELRAKAKIE